MKRYQVKVEMKALDLSKLGSGLLIVINDGSERLGTLEIGHGSLFWRSARKRNGRPIRWPAFADMLDRGAK
jgi:hypothetical protein